MALAVAFTSGCEGRHSNKEVFYLISVNQALALLADGGGGFKQAAAEYKVTARVVGPDGHDPQAELTELQNAVAAKPAGILISVADAAVLQPGIDAAVSAGIPVITMDSDAAGSRRLYFIGTNNLEAGRLGGQRVIEKLGGKGNVVFFTLAGQPNTEERLKGFKDVFASQPDIKIVDVVDIKADPKTAFDKTQQYMALTGPKKIDAFVCLDSASGKPVSDAVARVTRIGPGGDCLGCEPGYAGRNQGGDDRCDSCAEALHHGLCGAEGAGRGLPRSAGAADKDFSADSFSPYPDVCGYGHFAGGQEQCGCLHCRRRSGEVACSAADLLAKNRIGGHRT